MAGKGWAQGHPSALGLPHTAHIHFRPRHKLVLYWILQDSASRHRLLALRSLLSVLLFYEASFLLPCAADSFSSQAKGALLQDVLVLDFAPVTMTQ